MGGLGEGESVEREVRMQSKENGVGRKANKVK